MCVWLSAEQLGSGVEQLLEQGVDVEAQGEYGIVLKPVVVGSFFLFPDSTVEIHSHMCRAL